MREDESFEINQTVCRKSIRKISKSLKNPIQKVLPNLSNEEINERFSCIKAIGALAYLIVGTRLDILYYTFGVTSRTLENPTRKNVKIKYFLRYLKRKLN